MKSFFKYLLASFIAAVIALVVGIFIFLGVVGSMLNKEKVVEVKPNSILSIKLNQPVVDRADNNPFEMIKPGSFKPESSISLKQVLKNIKQAKKDKNIKGIYLNVDGVNAGSATVEEIRNALINFKDSGKFIISYADYYSQKAYYLASVADKIYVNPEGLASLQGLSAQVMFFKKTLEKIGIKPEVIRHGKFKSAVEPFLQNEMSEANKEQISTYLGSLWGIMLKGISEERSIEIAKLQDIADNLLVKNTKEAVDYGLVDGIRYYDQVIDELKEKTEVEKDKDVKFVSLSDYTHAPKPPQDKLIDEVGKIAVIFAQGQIGSEKGSNSEIGTENIAKAIRKARKDEKVKAIVLRVNSPGGSSLTSEIIYREMMLAKEAKPVIASMGDVAASGGYYIACPADTIVCSPNTITGSIGVFGLMFNARKLIEEKIGVNVQEVVTANHADMGSPFRDMNDVERSMIKASVEDVYDTFISHVAEGRGMTKEEVDKIGQGRVWSGENALEIGLVDVMGGLEVAVEIAANKAGVEDYKILELPEMKEPFEEIMKELQGQTSIKALLFKEAQLNPVLEHLKSLSEMEGVQMRLPYTIEIN